LQFSQNKLQQTLRRSTAFVVVVLQSQNFKLKLSRNGAEGIQLDAESGYYGGEVLNEVWFMRWRSQRTAKDNG
jgi:hypothetical protein